MNHWKPIAAASGKLQLGDTSWGVSVEHSRMQWEWSASSTSRSREWKPNLGIRTIPLGEELHYSLNFSPHGFEVLSQEYKRWLTWDLLLYQMQRPTMSRLYKQEKKRKFTLEWKEKCWLIHWNGCSKVWTETMLFHLKQLFEFLSPKNKQKRYIHSQTFNPVEAKICPS